MWDASAGSSPGPPFSISPSGDYDEKEEACYCVHTQRERDDLDALLLPVLAAVRK